MAKGILFEKDGIRVWAMSGEEVSTRRRLGFTEVKEIPDDPENAPNLKALNMKELRALAESEGLEGYKSLPKADLLEALVEKLEGDEQ